MKSSCSSFILIFPLSYLLYGVVSVWSMQANLNCSRPLNICRLSHRGLTGWRTEEFPVQNLQGAEVIGGGESVQGVILKTSQGDKDMTTDGADGVSSQVNAFIQHPDRKLLQVEQSNSRAPFDLIFYLFLLIVGSTALIGGSIGVLINTQRESE